ncbi:MAG: ImmA/IrrE family metallo-endopeptidase [Thermosediminibacteraceae bacterium]|nr:ImmA/IrrE family metallo-endopeptidase [Thermosediminibacteraceae bacterium]
MKEYTLFSVDRMEIEANRFAAELLIDETDICPDWTTDEISVALNVPKQLVDYKFGTLLIST